MSKRGSAESVLHDDPNGASKRSTSQGNGKGENDIFENQS